jgi:transcriptional regulator with XRE-family HTH domain
MRSAQRTTTAVLRLATGLSAEEFAQLIGKSLPTVRSLESGKLALSESTAGAITKKTGIHLGWLLNADPSAPLIDIEGKPWTIGTYERRRAGEMVEYVLKNNQLMVNNLSGRITNFLYDQIYDPYQFGIVVNRLESFLDKLEKEFPQRIKPKTFIEKLKKAYPPKPKRKPKT